jgi:glutathione S-transferase
VPQVLDYLGAASPEQGFIFHNLSIADISIACFLRDAAFAGVQVDEERWRRTAAFVDRVLELESFAKLKPVEERLRRTPLAQHRAALTAIGVSVTRETYGMEEPRRGVMSID